MQLDQEIGRHAHVEFSWANAHSGILFDEIADQLATNGTTGSSCCPTHRFDKFPDDSEMEDDRSLARMLMSEALVAQL
jgi:ribonuclease HI